MTQLSITLKNAELVRKGLQDLAAEIPKIGKLQIYRAGQAIVRKMKEYPPERRGQRYIRTYRFQGGWTLTGTTNGYTIRNAWDKAKYVVGNAYGLEQAWMHVSTDQGKRWNVFRDVQEDEINKLPEEISKEISMVARRVGL